MRNPLLLGMGARWMLDCASLNVGFCDAEGEGEDKAPMCPPLGSSEDVQTPFLSQLIRGTVVQF